MSKSTLLILFIFFTHSIHAQLIERKGDCYIYNNEEYTDPEAVEDLFSSNSEALDWHKKSKLARFRADFFGYSATLGLFASYLIIRSANKGKGTSPDPNFAGLDVALISCILGTIGITSKYAWASHSDKAVDAFNGAAIGDVGTSNSKSLSFGIVEHGVGVTLNF